MSSYTVIAFNYDNEAKYLDADFQLIVLGHYERSKQYLFDNPHKNDLAVAAEIKIYPKEDSRYTGIASVPEYEPYWSVYFLNDAALQLCKDANINLNAIGKINNVPRQYKDLIDKPSPYLPLIHRQES